MPVDRKLYTQTISKETAPNWPCPRCGGGHLRLIPESLSKCWTGDTQEASSHEFFDAEWVELRFVAMLKCDNSKCQEPSVVSGTGRVEEWPSEDGMFYKELFTPSHISPSPKLIAMPLNTPKPVVEELEQAFIASWSDFSSAGNRIRVAVERLMDSLKIPKTTVNKNNKRTALSLHSRIEKIKDKYPNTHELLLAIKWLGNAGSHSTVLTHEAVFDALDIFEVVLNELYSTHTSTIKTLAKQVNSRKGPRRIRKI